MTVGTPEHVVFSHSVEGLLVRALGDRVTPELSVRLRQLGVDLARPLLPAYPVPVWNRVLEEVARTLYPADELSVSVRRLGACLVEGYSQTLIGQAVMGLARLMGPRRALLRTKQNWRSGNNYTDFVSTELGPMDFRCIANEAGVSRWLGAGILEAGLTQVGARALAVTVESFTDTHATYRVTWSG